MQYKILTNSSTVMLEREVNAFITLGFMPVGFVQVATCDAKSTIYVQTMIKYD